MGKIKIKYYCLATSLLVLWYGQLCNIQSKSPSKPHAPVYWCRAWSYTGVIAGQRDPTLPFSLNELQEQANPPAYSVLLIYRRSARQRATFCFGDVWVGGGTANCRTRAIGETGGRTSVWVTCDRGGQLSEGVMGQDCCVGLGQARQPQLRFICVWKRCGFSITAEWTRRICMQLQASVFC
jgi:hypothetical protein